MAFSGYLKIKNIFSVKWNTYIANIRFVDPCHITFLFHFEEVAPEVRTYSCKHPVSTISKWQNSCLARTWTRRRLQLLSTALAMCSEKLYYCILMHNYVRKRDTTLNVLVVISHCLNYWCLNSPRRTAPVKIIIFEEYIDNLWDDEPGFYQLPESIKV